MAPKLLDVHQVAELLNISKRTAEYWQASGRLPGFVRLYGHRRWRSDAIEAWFAAGCPELRLGCADQRNPDKPISTIATVSGESKT